MLSDVYRSLSVSSYPLSFYPHPYLPLPLPTPIPSPSFFVLPHSDHIHPQISWRNIYSLHCCSISGYLTLCSYDESSLPPLYSSSHLSLFIYLSHFHLYLPTFPITPFHLSPSFFLPLSHAHSFSLPLSLSILLAYLSFTSPFPPTRTRPLSLPTSLSLSSPPPSLSIPLSPTHPHSLSPPSLQPTPLSIIHHGSFII